MATPSRLLGSLLFVFALGCFSAVLGQTNPPPADPHELVTREPRIFSKPADRSAALDLLGRARNNFNLQAAQVPYALKVSFETNGATMNEGSGTMEEFYDGHSQFRWTAGLGDVKVTRVGADRVYGTNPSQPIPLRIQLIRTVLLRPVLRDIGKFEIRAADVVHDGKPLTCFLLSYSLPPNPAPRSWVEREDCVDSETGVLRMWSEAPGIYAVYDYDGSNFHGHVLPRQVSIYEEGRLAVQIHVESLEDAPNLDANLFKPSEEMGEAAETFGLSSAGRLGPLRVDPSDGPTSRFFQPVIVHAILDAQDGSVLDAETLQNSSDDLGRAALDLVRNSAFDPTGFQQEMFINVHFHLPAATYGGAPIAVFHSSRVHWVRVDWRTRVPPVRPHVGR
ncbi:MAG: hypothetical protein WAM13_08615 [Candidatus Sulfotelmatobacter sp.]